MKLPIRKVVRARTATRTYFDGEKIELSDRKQLFAQWKSLASEQQLDPNWVYRELHIALAVPVLLAVAYRLWIEQAGCEEQSRVYRAMQTEFSSRLENSRITWTL
jgi:hypothetical protein